MATIRNVLMTVVAALAAPVAVQATTVPGGPTSDLKLERVVMLMRHGVRPAILNPSNACGLVTS